MRISPFARTWYRKRLSGGHPHSSEPQSRFASEVCYLCAEEKSNALGITDLLIHRRF